MKIRKNLKLSAQFNATSSLICKLNKSSWDVMSSPPSTPRPPSPVAVAPQVDVSAGNEGLYHLAAAAEELENLEPEHDKNKNNKDSADSATKKPQVLESKSCPPSKDASASSDSNPCVFYLRFGLPGRVKRRGGHSDNSGSSASKNLRQEHELNPLYLDSMITENFEYNEDEEEESGEKGKKKAKKSIKSRSLKSLK